MNIAIQFDPGQPVEIPMITRQIFNGSAQHLGRRPSLRLHRAAAARADLRWSVGTGGGQHADQTLREECEGALVVAEVEV